MCVLVLVEDLRNKTVQKTRDTLDSYRTFEAKEMHLKIAKSALAFILLKEYISHCLKITQNVAFEFSNFGIFYQFLSY